MNIKRKLTITSLILSLVPLLLVGSISYNYAEKALSQQLTQRLTAIASLQQTELERILTQNKERVALVSSRTQLRLSLREYFKDNSEKHRNQITRIINDAKTSITSFDTISILSLNGKIIASTAAEPFADTIFFDQKTFNQGHLDISAPTFFVNTKKQLRLLLSGPLRLDDRVLGVILIEANPHNIIKTITDPTGLGKTGEILLLKQDNDQNISLTPTRFNPQTTPREISPENTLPLKQTFRERKTIIQPGLDCRSIPVFAVCQFIEPLNLVLLVKINQEEANLAIKTLRNFMLAIIGCAALIIVLTTFYLAGKLTHPIIRLTKRTQDLAEGTFPTEPIPISNDEIGILGHAFNKMTTNLKSTQEELKNRFSELQLEIQKHRETSESLRGSEKRYREIYNAPSDAIFLHDAATSSILDANRAALKMFEYTLAEIKYEDIGSLSAGVAPYDLKNGVKKVELAMTEGPQVFEWQVKKQSGNIFWAEITLRYTRFSNQDYVIAVLRDIHARKMGEKELAKGHKLESVGLLAGGIAHDFNNILVAILGNINLALLNTEPKAANYSLLQEAEKATLRAKDLTQQLLTFAKGGDPVKKLAMIREIIEDSANFVLRGSNVRCQVTSPKELWPVEIDQGQMSQVIQNIIINGNQAMPEGGIIKVNCENIDFERSKKEGLTPHDYIKISIKDSGIGINPAQLDKIFDPYFSTKQQGSGLGLAVCHSIINKHDGIIQAYSEQGSGTTFTLYLPAQKDKTLLPAPKLEELVTTKQQGRILIMDDEEMVRSICKSMLEHIGYQVVLAENGEQTIALYQESLSQTPAIDLIIMDLTIPGGMGGEEAVVKIHEIDPKAKVIVSSGYSNDPIMANFKEYGFAATIAKPFQLKEFQNVLHQLLN